MLKMLGYGLQADKKTLTVKLSHPDRDAQFEHINTQTLKAVAEGNPVLSIDAKKRRKILEILKTMDKPINNIEHL
jgi:hypothetical protein